MKPSPPSALLDLGTINGYHLQAEPARWLFIVDGEWALLCSPHVFALALRFLRAPGQALDRSALLDEEEGAVSASTLRHRIAALRLTLAPLGITILRVTTYGYIAVVESSSDGHPRTDGEAGDRPASAGPQR